MSIVSARCSRLGANSVMNSAVPMAIGTANVIATAAMSAVPSNTAATPKFPPVALGANLVSVKKFQPCTRNASVERDMSKIPMNAISKSVMDPAEYPNPRKTRSALLRSTWISMGTSSRSDTTGVGIAVTRMHFTLRMWTKA